MKNIRHTFFLLLLALLMLALPVCAQEDADFTKPQEMTVIDNGTVKEILKSDMIMLNNNKRYRLDNVLVPPYEEPPAIDELKRMFLNKDVTAYTYHGPDDNLDRYGVVLAHIVTDKDVWIQEDLVSKGLAWAYSTPTSEQMVDVLKQVEEDARAQHLGFWKNPAYAIKTPDTVKDFTNSYQIVEGKILSVTSRPSAGVVFFNFSKDWKTGFTVRVRGDFQALASIEDPNPLPARNVSKENGGRNGNPLDWKGRVVRVRGWVTKENGPVMDVTHKEQIDFVPQGEGE